MTDSAQKTKSATETVSPEIRNSVTLYLCRPYLVGPNVKDDAFNEAKASLETFGYRVLDSNVHPLRLGLAEADGIATMGDVDDSSEHLEALLADYVGLPIATVSEWLSDDATMAVPMKPTLNVETFRTLAKMAHSSGQTIDDLGAMYIQSTCAKPRR